MKILKILLLLFLAISCTKKKIELYSVKNLEITVGEEPRIRIDSVEEVRSGLETIGVDSLEVPLLHVAVIAGNIEGSKALYRRGRNRCRSNK